MAVNLIIALNLLLFTGVNACRILYSLYALNLGASASDVGAIMAMLYVFPLVLSWPIGAVSDRSGARGLLLFGTASGGLGMLVPYFFPGLPALYFASAMTGMTIAFMTVLGQHLIGTLSAPSRRVRNFSNYALTGSLCNFIGPLFAGFAIDHLGYAPACAVIAAPLLLGLAVLAIWGAVLPKGQRSNAPGGNILHALADRRLWKMLTISSLSQVGNDLFQVFLPIYAHGAGLSASAIGAMLAALATGSFCVRLLLPRLTQAIGEARLLSYAFFLGAVGFLLVPLTHSAAMLGAVSAMFGVCQGCSQPLTMLLVFAQAEEGRAGEAVGIRMTVNNLARIIGPAAFGVIGASAGLLSVYWINAFLMGCGGTLSRPRKKRGP